MDEPTTYLGASSIHLLCENYKFQANTPLKIFKREEVCKGLKWIDISGCIGTLDENTFKNLPDLEIISLDKCNIENVKENTFSTLTNLKSISVRKSTFPLDQNTFKNCEKLNSLRFIQIKNAIKSALLFKDLVNLEDLMIDNTSELMLCSNTFYGLKNLLYLFIKNCNIQDFSEDAFEPLAKLETFYFTGNILDKFEPKAFLSLKNLTVFGLYNNNTTSTRNPEIDYQMFENLTNLDTISFPEENIRALQFEGFKNLKNVQLIIGKTKEDITDFLEKKNIGIQWTSDSDLTEDVDLTDPNIQICG